MKKTRKFFVALFALAVTLAMCFCFVACDDEPAEEKMRFEKASDSADGYATLYMPSDGQLDVMVLSDPQVDIWEKYQTVGSPGNDKTYEFIEDFVAATDPDFVVINGDLVMADLVVKSQVPYFEKYAEIFERLEVPWTFTFGNHDCDGQYTNETATADSEIAQCSKATLIDFMSDFEHCLVYTDDSCADGDGNAFVNVRDSKGELVYTMCLFDCLTDDSGYESVPTAEQVRWYRDTVNALSDERFGEDRAATDVVKSVIFTHVGIPEFKAAWDAAWNDGDPTEAYHYGMCLQGDYTDNYGDLPAEERIFDVVKELGSTEAIFMAHHHDNDFSVDYEGVRLTFGQHSGYSHSYRTTHSANGPATPFWKDVDFSRVDDYGDRRGGTLLTLTAAEEFGIEPVYAADALSDYMEKYYIDYDKVAEELAADPSYTSGITRGEGRAWRR